MQRFTGYEYTKIHVANQFGLDRLDWNDRLHWVNNNHPDLPELTDHAKNPIAFGKAVRALLKAESGFPDTNHTMGLDATASGIQVMAAMSGCQSSARAVNLINTGHRECVYDHMAQTMSRLLDHEVARDRIKKPVMTFFYGSQAVPKAVFGDAVGLKAFFKAMQEKLPGPYELMTMFQRFWDPNVDHYEWAMPDGHVAHVPVTIMEDKGVEIDEADHLRFTYRTQVQKPKDHSRALAANIVHSVDAWICRQMTKRLHAMNIFMIPIHDCFFAHPNHMNQVREVYRELLAEAAEMNLVSMILSQIAGRTIPYTKMSNQLPDLIRKAEYALS